MNVAGIDFSSRFVDVVLLDESSDRAVWHRFELTGADAFDRARAVGLAVPGRAMSFWDDVLAVGIEDPRGYGAGSLYRVQGAILSCVPQGRLVQPWIPSVWRKQVGLKGNSTKEDVEFHVRFSLAAGQFSRQSFPPDFFDAYCIALATRQLLQTEKAA